MESTITKMKNSLDRLNSRVELAEKSVTLKIEQKQLTNLKSREKKISGKMNRTLETWMILNILTHV